MAFYYLEVIVTDPHDPTLPEVLVQSIELTPENMSLQPGDMGHFTAAISPENTSNPGLFWVSSDLDIVRVVDPEGGVVLGVNPGEATIFAMAMDGSEVWASATVVVEPLGFMATIWGALISGVEWFLGCFGYQRPVTWPDEPTFAGANNLQQFLEVNNVSINTPSNSRVDVVVSGNTITITTGFNYTGDLTTMTLGGVTYQTLFENGIRNYWTNRGRTFANVFGRFNVTVNVVIDNSVNRPASRRIDVIMNDELGISDASVGPTTIQANHIIQMYQGDSRSTHGNNYSATQFSWVAAHEFGHILGLRHTTVAENIMTDGLFGRPVITRNIENVIRAYATGTAQS